MTTREVEKKAGRRANALVSVAALAVTATLTVAGIYGLNRFVHQQYVMKSAPRQSLRLMTWNVGKIYLPWESRVSNQDLRHIAKVIREVNPHVVALQEMRDAEQLGRLLVILGRPWRGAIPADAYDRRAAVLTRLRARFLPLPTTSGRIAQCAIVEPPGRAAVTVVSLHLDAFDPRRRLEQAQEILAEAGSHGDRGLYLLGDFNLDPATAAKRSHDLQLYQLLRGQLVDAGHSAGVTTIFSRRLDYVFYKDAHVLGTRAQVLRGQGINAMDHEPLVVDVKLSH